jgi:hypothetical protein
MTIDAKTEDDRTLIHDVTLQVQAMEVAWMKETLWRLAVRELIEQYDVKDEAAFARVEELMRDRWQEVERVPGAAPIMQDALHEFRHAARELMRQPA